jgi:uncharacterized RDD family membrane protein YckC
MLIAAAEGFRRERPTMTNPPPPVVPAAASASRPPSPLAARAAQSTLTVPSSAVGTRAEAPAPTQPPVIPPVLGQSRPRPGDMPPEDLMTLPRVGFWPRLGAALLDFVLVIFVTGSLRLMNHGPQVIVPLLIAYHVAMWTWRGTTLGGIVFSLRVIRLDGHAPDFTVALVRALASCLSFVVAGLGFFWASWNPDRQAWHDLIAGTVIVRTPRAMPLV